MQRKESVKIEYPVKMPTVMKEALSEILRDRRTSFDWQEQGRQQGGKVFTSQFLAEQLCQTFETLIEEI